MGEGSVPGKGSQVDSCQRSLDGGTNKLRERDRQFDNQEGQAAKFSEYSKSVEIIITSSIVYIYSNSTIR